MATRIAIIGGGYTGLVAAWRLVQDPANVVTVFERGETLGGLAGGFTMQGAPLEKTYHHLFRTDEDILKLVEELGLGAEMEWWPSSMALCRGGKRYPFSGALDLLKFSPLPFLDRIRFGAVAFALGKIKDWRRFESITAAAWMRKWAGSAPMETVWGPLLRGKFSRYADEVSMAWLWARVHIRANSRGKAGEQLGYLRHGFVSITHRLEALLQSKAQIHTGATIDSIERVGETLILTRGGVREEFDRVIFTGSSRAFATLLPQTSETASYRAQLSAVSYLGAICLVFATDQKIGEAYWTNINEDDAPFLVFLRHTKFIPAERYAGKEVYYLGAYLPMDSEPFLQSQEALEAHWFGYLQKLYPDFQPERIVEKHLFRLRDAQHVVTVGYGEKIASARTPIPGLYLANFSQIYPEDRGTNYAVREGNAIAQLVRQDLFPKL